VSGRSIDMYFFSLILIEYCSDMQYIMIWRRNSTIKLENDLIVVFTGSLNGSLVNQLLVSMKES
jgi:hypothetical protein